MLEIGVQEPDAIPMRWLVKGYAVVDAVGTKFFFDRQIMAVANRTNPGVTARQN